MKARARRRASTGDYVLTPGLRRRLKKPLGRLFPTAEVKGDEFLSLVAGSPFVIAVGDRVTETFQETTGRSPDVSVVDGKERRAARAIPNIARASTLKTTNPPGTITRVARAAVKKAVAGEKPAMVVVDGEEDLLAIPAVIEAPLGGVVLYGQPLVGVVVVSVDAEAKARAKKILEGMAS